MAKPGILNVATNWYTDGVMVSNISHSGVMTQIRRDAMRRETARIDGRGNTTRTEYDALGRVAATIDALTNATTYAYDAMNCVAAITNALGDATIYEYDHRGNKTYEGGATYPVRYTYDIYGNKTTMTTYRHEPDGGVGHAALPATGDGVGRGVPTAPPGDTTTWLYDEASGVMTNKVYADGKGPRYTYTDDGRLATRTWARGIVTTYTYDGWDNLVETAYSDDTPTKVFYRDAIGRLISTSGSENHDNRYGYDEFFRCTNEVFEVGEDRFDVFRSYDGEGRCRWFGVNFTNALYAVKSRRFGADGLVAGYGLTNSLGRGLSVSLKYDDGRITDVSYELPDRGAFSCTFTRESPRPDLIVRRSYLCDGQPVYCYENIYDALGRPTNAVDSASLIRAYRYTFRSELAESLAGTNAFSYAYDAIGNRTTDTFNAVTKSYAANNLNQYAHVCLVQMAYDDDGNLSQDGRFAYAYDADNQMSSARPTAPNEGDLAVVCAYDNMHRRIMKRVERYDGDEWVSGETHTFVYDGGNIVLEKITLSNGLTSLIEYFWGNDLTGSEQGAGGIGGLLAVSVDGEFYVPCYDHNGNIVCYVSESGAIVAQYVYDPYGNIIEQYGNRADEFVFRFSTKYYDHETGLVGYQRRFYRSDIGRWLNRDPIEEEGGINLYAFCFENPIAFCDADGAVVITGYILDPRIPHWWDHFGSDTAPLGQETWFDLNYSGWLNYARSYYKQDVSLRIDCISELLDFKSRRFSIKPTRRIGNFTTSGTVIRGNETIFGDEGQSAWSADKVLGRFAIDIVTPVHVSYVCSSNCYREYHWETEIYVEDILGTQPGDKIYPLLKNIAKSRTVKRAIWKISGEGVCKCK